MSGASPDVVHACVVAGGPNGADTHYLRAGRGAPVLLLAGDPAVAGALIGGIPRRFRSIAPNFSGAKPIKTSEFNAWIRGFLDALGIGRVAIVVGPCFAAQVLGFSLLEPDRIDRVVFLLGACGTSAAEDGQGISDRFDRAGQPLFVTPFDATDPVAYDRTMSEIAAFLTPAEVLS